MTEPLNNPIKLVVAGKTHTLSVLESRGTTSFSVRPTSVHVAPIKNAPSEAIIRTSGSAAIIAAIVPYAIEHARATNLRVTANDPATLKLLSAYDDLRSDRGAFIELEVPKQVLRFCRIFVNNVPGSARLESTKFRKDKKEIVATWSDPRPQLHGFTAMRTFTAALDQALMARLRARETQQLTAVRYEEPADLDHGASLTKDAIARAVARGAISLDQADTEAWSAHAAAQIMPTLVRAALAETGEARHEAVVEAASMVASLAGVTEADRSTSGVEQELATLMEGRSDGS